MCRINLYSRRLFPAGEFVADLDYFEENSITESSRVHILYTFDAMGLLQSLEPLKQGLLLHGISAFGSANSRWDMAMCAWG